MTPEVAALWARSQQALLTAKKLVSDDPDCAASRAYYAAFYAVTAVFASEGRVFRKHSGIESAVHRDLVSTGRWKPEVGEAFSRLVGFRSTADYGGLARVSRDDALRALADSQIIVDSACRIAPGLGAAP